MEKYNNWKLKFYTIWAGQAVSLITSAILQMAIIFYLTEKTGSYIVELIKNICTSRFFTLCGLWTSHWCISGSS